MFDFGRLDCYLQQSRPQLFTGTLRCYCHCLTITGVSCYHSRMGRPSSYTDEIADAICAEVALGLNLNKIGELNDFPTRQTIYNWLTTNPVFFDKYTRARSIRAHGRSDRIDAITQRVLDGDLDPNAARVVIDAEKWQAGKESPKSFGDKMQQEHTGANGEPLKLTIEVIGVPPNGSNT